MDLKEMDKYACPQILHIINLNKIEMHLLPTWMQYFVCIAVHQESWNNVEHRVFVFELISIIKLEQNIQLVIIVSHELKKNENGEWKRLYSEELHSLYHSPSIVRVIKFKRLRWAGHVARMEKKV